MKNRTIKIILGDKPFLVISLSEPLNESTEVFPGDPSIVKKTYSDIDKTGYHHYVWEISDHSFHPHGDAPNHQNPELKHNGFDFFGMDYFFNKAAMIDLSETDDSENKCAYEDIEYHLRIEIHHLKEYEDIIKKRGAIIIRTGYDRVIESNKKHLLDKIPFLSAEAGKYLSHFDNLKVFGIDSLTVDFPGNHVVHQSLKKCLIVESLVNLYSIPKNSQMEFDLQTSTISIEGATGGPVNAFAFINIKKENNNE